MALSSTDLKLAKSLYWILLAVVVLYIGYMLFTTNRPIAGIIWIILGFMMVYVVYPYYFPPGDPGSQWPPYITACPDYLTLITTTQGTKACVDYVGLGSPLLKKSDPALPPAAGDSAHVFDPSGTVAQKTARAQQYGLSWEGIN